MVQLMFHTNVVFVWKLNGTTQGVSSELVFAKALGPLFERALGSLLAKTSSELTPCMVQLMFHTNVVFVWKLNGTTQGVSSELVFANALVPFFERALGSLLAKT